MIAHIRLIYIQNSIYPRSYICLPVLNRKSRPRDHTTRAKAANQTRVHNLKLLSYLDLAISTLQYTRYLEIMEPEGSDHEHERREAPSALVRRAVGVGP